MRMILIAVVLCFVFCAAEGFVPGFNLPTFPIPGAICKKNSCKTSKDCKGKYNYCSKIFLCQKNKICIAKPKVTTPATTTTPTTTKPTTKPKPTYPCPYPLENQFAKINCKKGPRKNTICTVSCKDDRCHVGSSITRCACTGGQCKWTRGIESFCKRKKKDSCKNGGGCKSGYSCVSVGCSNICKKECKDSCKTNSDCPLASACRRTSCGKKCQPIAPQCPKPCTMSRCPMGYACLPAKPQCENACVKIRPPCPRPCKLGNDQSCQTGYMCVAATAPCVSKCVKKTDPPKCPLFHPLSRMPRNVTEFCNTEPLSCKTDIDCGSDAVCCNSALCKRMMCSKKVNNCPPKMTKRCITNKDCENAEDFCVYNLGGCKTCIKGFHCPPYGETCREDKDCTAPFKCRAGENGCLSCRLALPPKPQPPSTCPDVQCHSNQDCINGQECLPYRIRCKRCQVSFGEGDPESCKGQKCTTNAQCKSGKCVKRAHNCKVCIPALPPSDCDIRKMCTTNSNCKEGEVCFIKGPSCRVCVGRLCNQCNKNAYPYCDWLFKQRKRCEI